MNKLRISDQHCTQPFTYRVATPVILQLWVGLLAVCSHKHVASFCLLKSVEQGRCLGSISVAKFKLPGQHCTQLGGGGGGGWEVVTVWC